MVTRAKNLFNRQFIRLPFGHFPNLVTVRGDRYRDALTCAKAVETVLELEADMLLYGHHQPVVGRKVIQTELAVLRDAIHCVHDETVRGMNEGKDLHTLMQSIELPPELEVGRGMERFRGVFEQSGVLCRLVPSSIHHRVIQERVPPQSIHADLIEMSGGVGVLVKEPVKNLRVKNMSKHCICSILYYRLILQSQAL